MNIGLVFPQREFEADAAAVRAYAQAAEALGYRHVLAYDHVLGANPQRPGGWRGPYTYQDPFYSPFLLFSFMAGATERLGFVTGVLILPQRETALVAKQAATLDVLCQGRLRLGIGVGWNAVEYVALNQDFHTRGARQAQQVAVLRRLWTEPLITYRDRWHHIPDAGLNPLPVQQPIPVWFGGSADAVIRRMAQLGDGWLPNERRAAQAQPLKDKLQQYREEAGRSETPFGIEARLQYGDGDPHEWATVMEEWRDFGATHLSLNTMNAGLQGAEQHMKAIRRFAEEMGVGD